MTVHKEGFKTILIGFAAFVVVNLISFKFLSGSLPVVSWIIFIATAAVFLFLISFFRIPNRTLTVTENGIVSPADGKVVVIEKTMDDEFFKGEVLQISVFMSPLNVHVNRFPTNGTVVYNQYHQGKYLVAWHPKSSTENERHSIVIEQPKGKVLVKQIAGALAKRIINYSKVGGTAVQNEEMGFIKFGSRVDLLLPTNAKVKCNLNQVVKGGVTVLAEW
jgi:phosphatidylserine decarboxylase